MISTNYRGVNRDLNISELMQGFKPSGVLGQQAGSKFNVKQLKERHVQHGKGKPYSVIKQASFAHNEAEKIANAKRRSELNYQTNKKDPAPAHLHGKHSAQDSQIATDQQARTSSHSPVLSLYLNTKNFSDLHNNYSYRAQLAKQIQKVQKYQPNVSLSKLIDLNEFKAHEKVIKDNLVRNIAQNFQQARARIRQQK